jgi:hypothetical protein
MHGHDFWIVAQGVGTFNPTTTNIARKNPPRRDVATLPGNGVSTTYLIWCVCVCVCVYAKDNIEKKSILAKQNWYNNE